MFKNIGTRTLTRNVRFRFPEMPAPYVAKLVVDGILENRRIFSVPNHFMLPVALVRYAHFNAAAYQCRDFPLSNNVVSIVSRLVNIKYVKTTFVFFRTLPDHLQSLINKIFYVRIVGFPKDVELSKKYQR